MNKSSEFLEEMYKENGDFFIHYIKENKPVWNKWILYSTATEEQKETANLRQLAQCELLLDIEDPKELAKTVKDVRQDFKSFTVWKTGSRGCHISILIPKLKELPEEEREQIRLFFIKKYNCDTTKKSDKTLVALEYAPHFKTGNHKSLEGSRAEGINILPYPDLPIQPQKKEIIQTVNNDWLKNDHLLKYVIENKIPDGTKRNNVLFKNLAIGLVQSGLTEEGIKEYAEKIVVNCEGKNINEFKGWVKKAQEGKITEFNKIELNIWIDENLLPINKYQETIEEPKAIHEKIVLSDLLGRELPQTNFIVDPILPEGCLILIGGKASEGKSIFSLAMSMCIAAKPQFIIFDVPKNKKVLYYDLENGQQVVYWRGRYIADGFGIPPNDLNNMHISEDFNRQDIEAEFNFAKDYDIIVLDSYRRFLKGDESDSEITDKFYNQFLKPLKELKKTIIILHNFRKSRPEDMTDSDLQDLFRGSSDIAAQVDLIFGIIKFNEKTEDKSSSFDLNIMKAKNRLGLPIKDMIITVYKDDNDRQTTFNFKKFGYIDPNEPVVNFILSMFVGEKILRRGAIITEVKDRFRCSIPTIDRILKGMVSEEHIIKNKQGSYSLRGVDNNDNIYNDDKSDRSDKPKT
jgi:hypothetical protein